MLVLSRKAGEEICIGGGITLVVIEITGKRVKLGFKAPGDVIILRSEISPTPPETAEEPPVAS